MALHFTKSILNFSKTIFDFSKLISRFSKLFSHFSKSSVCFIKWSSCSHGSRLGLLAALSDSCLLVLLLVWILTIRCGAMAPPLVASCGTRYKVGQKGPAIFLKISCVVLQFQRRAGIFCRTVKHHVWTTTYTTHASNWAGYVDCIRYALLVGT